MRSADAEGSRSAVEGEANFRPRFGDKDVNQDGIVTAPEFQRIIEQEHNVYSDRP